MGEGWYSSTILDVTIRLLYPRGKSPRCLLDRVNGLQSRSGRFGDEKKKTNLLPLWEIEPRPFSL